MTRWMIALYLMQSCLVMERSIFLLTKAIHSTVRLEIRTKIKVIYLKTSDISFHINSPFDYFVDILTFCSGERIAMMFVCFSFRNVIALRRICWHQWVLGEHGKVQLYRGYQQFHHAKMDQDKNGVAETRASFRNSSQIRSILVKACC